MADLGRDIRPIDHDTRAAHGNAAEAARSALAEAERLIRRGDFGEAERKLSVAGIRRREAADQMPLIGNSRVSISTPMGRDVVELHKREIELRKRIDALKPSEPNGRAKAGTART